MGRLEGKVVIITGAAQGIGAEFARNFANEGALIVSADITPSEAIVEEIKAAGGQAIGVEADITNRASLENMVQIAEESFGPVEVLINNAALFSGITLKPMEQLTEEEWDRMLTINVRGVWQTSIAVIPSMRKNGCGKIVNISSGTVHKGPLGQLHYVASKSAVLGMGHSMARELAPDNITVNTISPSLTMSEGVLANPEWQKMRQGVVAARVIQREMQPMDLVGTALYLSTPDSNFITGQSINVDGGAQMT